MAVLAFMLVLAAAAALVGAVLVPGDGFDLRLLAVSAGACLLAFGALSRVARHGRRAGSMAGEDGEDVTHSGDPAWSADPDPAREAERRSEAAWRAREDR